MYIKDYIFEISKGNNKGMLSTILIFTNIISLKKYYFKDVLVSLGFFVYTLISCYKKWQLEKNMISETLKTIRQFNRLSQTELANAMEISKSRISEIESGKIIPSIKMIEKYSNYFDIPTSSIYFLSERLENRNNSSFLSKKIIDILKWIASDDDNGEIIQHDQPSSFGEKIGLI